MEPSKALAKLEGEIRYRISRDQFRSLDRVSGLKYHAIKPLVSIQNAPPEPIGTGVLLAIRHNVFLLTAAHALENFDQFKVYMPYQDYWIPVGGKSYRTPKPLSGTHVNDPRDAAVMVIDGEARDLLRSEALTMNDIYLHSDVLDYGLVVMGYPLTRFKRTGMLLDWRMARATFDTEPERTYRRLRFDPKDHILMKWRRKIYREGNPSGPVSSPSLVGMSGGPVWVIPGFRRPEFSPELPFVTPKLVGIFTERRRSSGVVIASTLSFHLSLISLHHPELKALFQEAIDERDIAKIESQRNLFPIFNELGIKPMPDYLIEGHAPRWTICYVPTGMILDVWCEQSVVGDWVYDLRVKHQGRQALSPSQMERTKQGAITRAKLQKTLDLSI